jgi:uncharacterized iron-regulated membrane protein
VDPPPDAERLPVTTLLSAAREQRPDQAPTAVTLKADRSAPAALTLGAATVYQNPYTGQLLGSPTTDVRAAMTELRAWHRWLSLDGERRALGKAISGWSNLIFLGIVLSGIYLWLPRKWNWQTVRAVLLFRGGLSGKARDFNWHNVIGIWSAVPLAIVVATATPISFTWANALVYRVVGEEPPAPAAAGARPGNGAGPSGETRIRANGEVDFSALDALWARAEQQVPEWRSINLRLPTSSVAPAVFAIDSGNGGQPQLRSTLTLDAAGAVVRWEPFSSQSLGRRLRSWSRFTHTGEYYGIAGQTIAGLVSAGGVVLVFTGIALAIRRFASWIGRARRRGAVSSDEAASRAA